MVKYIKIILIIFHQKEYIVLIFMIIFYINNYGILYKKYKFSKLEIADSDALKSSEH